MLEAGITGAPIVGALAGIVVGLTEMLKKYINIKWVPLVSLLLSIALVIASQKSFDVDTILMGFGLVSDAIHSPNENFGLDRLKKGIDTVIRFFNNYSKYQQFSFSKD